MASGSPQRTLVIGAGPVGALAALYAANRGDEVEVYELRGGEFMDPTRCYPGFLSNVKQIFGMHLQSHSISPNPSI